MAVLQFLACAVMKEKKGTKFVTAIGSPTDIPVRLESKVVLFLLSLLSHSFLVHPQKRNATRRVARIACSSSGAGGDDLATWRPLRFSTGGKVSFYRKKMRDVCPQQDGISALQRLEAMFMQSAGKTQRLPLQEPKYITRQAPNASTSPSRSQHGKLAHQCQRRADCWRLRLRRRPSLQSADGVKMALSIPSKRSILRRKRGTQISAGCQLPAFGPSQVSSGTSCTLPEG